jgi:hypothetical protein
MVDVALPATIGDAAVTVDKAADTVPAVPVALKVTGLPAMPVPAAVAVSVLVPALEPSVQLSTVAIPLAFVVTAVVGFTVPPPEPTANVTAPPATGLPLASRTITEGGEPTGVPTVADWGFILLLVIAAAPPAVTATAAVCDTGVPLIVAEMVFPSATVEPNVTVMTPLAFAAPVADGVNVLPIPVALSATLAPAIGLSFASRAVTVIVDEPLPAVIVAGWASTLDRAADTGPAFTTTVAVGVTATPLIVAVTVLEPAAVELSVAVMTPPAFVVPVAEGVKLLPRPVALSVTVASAIGLPFASRAVTVTSEDPVPAVIGDVAATVDWDADTAAALTVTVAVSVTRTVPFTVAVMVFVPAAVELKVPVICPLAFVVPTGWVSVFDAPVAVNVTLAPLTGLSKPSLTVTVMVAALEPVLATMVPGAVVTSDRPELGAAALPVAVKMTGLPLSPGDVAVSVFVPA